MVPTPLVGATIDDGRALAERLAQHGAPISGAYWLYTLELVYARLYIVSPSVDQVGPRDMLGRIRKALSTLEHNSISLSNTSVISPRDQFVEAVRAYLKRAGQTREFRVTGVPLNNVLVDDMYVYWLE